MSRAALAGPVFSSRLAFNRQRTARLPATVTTPCKRLGTSHLHRPRLRRSGEAVSAAKMAHAAHKGSSAHLKAAVRYMFTVRVKGAAA